MFFFTFELHSLWTVSWLLRNLSQSSVSSATIIRPSLASFLYFVIDEGCCAAETFGKKVFVSRLVFVEIIISMQFPCQISILSAYLLFLSVTEILLLLRPSFLGSFYADHVRFDLSTDALILRPGMRACSEHEGDERGAAQ